MHNKIYAIPIEVMQGTGEEVMIFCFVAPEDFMLYLEITVIPLGQKWIFTVHVLYLFLLNI